MKLIAGAAMLLTLAGPATAQVQAPQAPFEPALMRLSEILGSLHYLRNLCGSPDQQWRMMMERLIETEKPDDQRKARLTANFNRGYRSFASVYTVCTDAASTAFERYRAEGEKLAAETAARFGN